VFAFIYIATVIDTSVANLGSRVLLDFYCIAAND
jgi:hypothetical protein